MSLRPFWPRRRLSTNDCCRLILKGECEQLPDVNLLRQKLDGLFRELQIRDETTIKRDIWAQLGQDTLSGVFLGKLNRLYKAAKSTEEREKLRLPRATV